MRKKMPENEYRASRICRVLGNPTAYKIIKLLLKSKKTPSALANDSGFSLPLISLTLRTLRNIDLVRYEIRGNEKLYWIKDEFLYEVCRAVEKLVIRIWHDNW